MLNRTHRKRGGEAGLSAGLGCGGGGGDNRRRLLPLVLRMLLRLEQAMLRPQGQPQRSLMGYRQGYGQYDTDARMQNAGVAA